MSRRLYLFGVAATPILVLALPWVVLRAGDEPQSGPGAAAHVRPSLTLVAVEKLRVVDTRTSEERVLATLAKPTKMQFVEIPLRDAIASLAEQHKLTILLDGAKLSDEGIQVEQPVTLSVENISLKSGLNLLLSPLQLTWVIRDEVLQFTTKAGANRLETRVLSIQGLLKAGHDPDDLIDMLTATVHPETWDQSGGEGAVRTILGTLVIRQTQEIQFEIRRVLTELETAAAGQGRGPVLDRTISLKAYPTLGVDADELAKAVPELVEPVSWDSAGGDGVIRAVKGVLLVKNTRKVHRAVERLLTDLKETAQAGAATGIAADTRLPSAPAPTAQPTAPVGNSAKPQPPSKR
ncbi:MAG: hypothetical protein HZA46_03220 [Planctomycetales bacterium]|nr:hypothetical protein [Planctomycetales bacterium]